MPQRRHQLGFLRGFSLLLLLLAGTGAALHALANAWLAKERPRVEAMLAEATGAPARVQRVRLSWQGGQPRVGAEGVRLMLDDKSGPPLRVQALRLGVNLQDLLRARVTPHHLQISGVWAALREDAQGRWQLGPAQPRGAFDWEAAASAVAGLDRIELADIAFALQPFGGEAKPLLRLTDAELIPERGGWRVRAQAQDAAGDGRLKLSGRVEGKAAQPQQWRQHWNVSFDGDHDLAASFGLVFPDAAWPRLDGLRLQAELRRQGGGDSFSWLGTASLHLTQLLGTEDAALRDVAAAAGLRLDGDGAALQLQSLEIAGEPQLDELHLTLEHGADSPLARGTRERAPGWVESARLRAPWLALDGWTPAVAGMFGENWPRLHGRLERLNAELRPTETSSISDWQLRYSVTLQDVGFDTPVVGATGLSGTLAGDEQGGRLELDSEVATLALPRAFDAVPELAGLSGQAEWTHAPDSVDIDISHSGFRLGSLDVEADGVLHWTYGEAPELRATARVQGDDVADAKPLMPHRWHEGLREYLDEAIGGARLDQGEVRFAATLEPGLWWEPDTEFEVELAISDGAMAFHPEWPAARALHAQVEISREHIAIRARRARWSGLELRNIAVDIAPLSRGQDGSGDSPVLTAEVRHGDPLSALYKALAATPLADGLSGLLEHTRGAGDAVVELALHMPLNDVQSTRASGNVAVDGAQLQVHPIAATVEDIRGTLHFVNQSVTAQGFSARLHGEDVAARIDTVDGVSRLHAYSRIDIGDGDALARFVPEMLRAHLSGVLPVQAEVQLTPVDGETRIDLALDSAPLRSILPEPLHFDARAGRAPMHIGLVFAGDTMRRLELRLPGELHLLQADDSTLLHLGAGVLSLPRLAQTAPGIHLSGHADVLDLSGWTPLLRRMATSAGEEEDPLSASAGVSGGALNVSRLRLGRLAAPDLTLRLERHGDSLRVHFDGSSRGEIVFSDDHSGAPGSVEARFDRLWLERMPGEENGTTGARPRADLAPLPPLSPAELPALDMLISDLMLEGRRLGELDLRLRQDGGWQVEQFALTGGALRLQGDGYWRAAAGGDTPAALELSATTARIDDLLTAFGYARTMEAERMEMKADLRWSSFRGFDDLALAEGTVSLSAENGRLHQVRPGAGRALGLLNFYALPRRMAMNFRDLTDSGLHFDALSGSLRLADGNAHSDDLSIDGPGLRITSKGRIGLVARDYDQRVSVYPQLTGGVTVGAAVLGGPVGLGLAMLVRELFDAPLDRATRISYHLSGSWDDPEITPGEIDTINEEGNEEE